MVDLPFIYQVRRDCIVGYPDYSVLPVRYGGSIIRSSGNYSASARRKFKKYLELWSYTVDGIDSEFSFITLTLASQMDSSINYSLLLKRLLEKLFTRYGSFNYCWKIEFQLNGNLHFHLICDCSIDWKIVRSQWNRLQKCHVDEYCSKMKSKYFRGYFFDSSYLDKNGNVVSDEIQFKRFLKGRKCGWRNPNSTDVKIVSCADGIGAYIGKYISKSSDEESSSSVSHSIKRFYGCSDSIRGLKYCTIGDYDLSFEVQSLLIDSKIKDITDSLLRYRCSISSKLYCNEISSRESEQLLRNRDLLSSNRVLSSSKLVEKEVLRYDKFFS